VRPDRASSQQEPNVNADAATRQRPPGAVRRFATQRPIVALSLVSIGISVPLIMAFLVAGLDPMPAKFVELLVLPGTAVLITSWIGGRAAVRRLFAGLVRWRIGLGRWLLILLAMPVLTIGVGAVTGTLRTPQQGWVGVALMYVLVLLFSATTANLWEELAWSGFVQTRLMARHGLLLGSLLTAVPMGLIHLPLAFESEGWAGTTWHTALVNTAWLLAALPFFRYLAGVLLTDTKGSVLAVGVLHGSFNAAGSLAVLTAGTEYVVAVIVLAVLVAGARAVVARSGETAATEDRTNATRADADLGGSGANT
jgi:membrane protease YdiL (CAAX protease family)